MARKHKPEEIIGKLREAEIVLAQGGTVADAGRQIGVAEQSYYRWRKEHGGLKMDQAWRISLCISSEIRLGFFDIALLRRPGQFALQLAKLGILACIARLHPRALPLLAIERVLTNPEALRNLGYRILTLGDLRHGITLELIAQIRLPPHRLQSSKIRIEGVHKSKSYSGNPPYRPD